MKEKLYKAKRKWRIIKYSAGRWQYLLLLAISIVFAIVHIIILAVTSPSQILLNPLGVPVQAQSLLNWSGRLSASIGGAYLTSVAVDGVFRVKKQEDERKARIIAYRELSEELREEKILVERLFKSAASSPIEREII